MAGLIVHVYTGMYPGRATQVGLTVGKDCGNSVQRHRTSRRIRAAIRPVVPKLPPGTGVVVKALPEIHAVVLDSHLITESVLTKMKP
jgi:ribonuclease P protein component